MLIGDLQGPTARIDRAGTITSLDAGWRVEWGIGGEDRWRLAHDERAVRQTPIEDTPTSETWLRVPGGDVIQRVAASNDGSGRALVIEFENASPTAVVVAVVARVAGLVEGSAEGISVDGSSWMRGERPAGGVVVVDGDPWPTVMTGPGPAPVDLEGAEVGAGLLLAVPHRQCVKVLVGVEGELPAQIVDPADVATGWRKVAAAGVEIDVPDTDLVSAWRRVVCDLILAAGSTAPIAAAEAAWWLDVAGLHGEADRARATVVEAALDGALADDVAGAALRALASRDLLAGDPSGLDELAGPLADAAGSTLDRATAGLVAAALESDLPKPAADARRLADSLTVTDWTVATRVADGAARVIEMIVDQPHGDGPVALLPELPETWLGQPIDVRGLATRAGSISFSVRWHGDRPAVLWERTGALSSRLGEITFPGLDPSWSSGELSGEALLAAPVRA